MASKIIVDQLEKTGGTLNALTLPLANATANQYIKNDGAGALSWATLPASPMVGQVLQATKTDTSTSTSTSFVDISDLSQAITPASASSRFLVTMSLQGNGTPSVTTFAAQIVRDSTPIAIGDADGSRTRATSGAHDSFDSVINCMTVSWIDEPATASAITYKIQGVCLAAGTFYINRPSNNADTAGYGRVVSTLTVMELLS